MQTIEINDSLRAIAARQGFTLTVVDDPDMPVEATRTGSRLLAMNFADLEHLVAWLDGNDRAAATDTRPVVAPQLVSVPRTDGTSGHLPADDLRALAAHVDNRDSEPLTDAELRHWFTVRGVQHGDLQLYVGQNRGKTLDELEAEYDRICGRMA